MPSWTTTETVCAKHIGLAATALYQSLAEDHAILNVMAVPGLHLVTALSARRTQVETPTETVFVTGSGQVMIVQSLVVSVILCVRILVLDHLPVIVYRVLSMRLGMSLVVVLARCIGQTIIAHIM